MKTSIAAAAVALATVVAGGAAHAAFINAPVPSNAYITLNGYDWAWAFPLPAANGLDLSYQASQGWYIPTATELAFAPLATDFLFVGANVPFNGTDPVSGAYFAAVNSAYVGDGACATPYFSNVYYHCDWQDGLGQLWGPWAGMTNAWSFAEQLVVRPSAVPEPASLALLGLGLAGLSATRRRKIAR